MYLKELCELSGVSGDETAVRSFIKDKIKDYADFYEVDSIGNVIAFKKGKKSSKKVMLSCHTDEVGFIISAIGDKGFLEFKTVGGIDTKVIISKRVRVGKNKLPGVIATKAIHLQEKSERKNIPKVSSLYIDIGAKSNDDAQKYVSLGDYASFDTDFEELGDLVKAKAIDDRAGCAILLELIKYSYEYDTYFCFMAQEETGLRGAKIAAAKIKPDIALVIEATTASDVADTDEKDYVVRVGEGVVISFADRSTIVNDALYKKLLEIAKSENIMCQTKKALAGGNDSGAIHQAVGGIKTASLSVPTRYIHSPCSVASIADITATKDLAKAFLNRIDEFLEVK